MKAVREFGEVMWPVLLWLGAYLLVLIWWDPTGWQEVLFIIAALIPMPAAVNAAERRQTAQNARRGYRP